ncbi:GHKL domain-containing protein [Companilactobacillus alimentarius]|uniref:sensor histidine kinase n=3 Tax=Companilactobacillus alimentarius TaxID=1602 RepID=UPI0028B510E9|nr:GHKL domain-containing protein [Companilactobacillus alimentarius]MDT6952498.1 GHKL domain-containing protein [Companilactobacillus alimentarius]
MIEISVIGTIIDDFFTKLIFFYTFINIYYINRKISWKIGLKISLLFIYSLILDYFLPNWMIFTLLVAMYFLLNKGHSINYQLINSIVLGAILELSLSIVSSSVIVYLNKKFAIDDLPFVLIDLIICSLLAMLFILLYRNFHLNTFMKKQNSFHFSLLLSYLYISLFLFMSLIQYFRAYKKLIVGIILFLIIQTILTLLYSLSEIKKQKESLEKELLIKQIDNLKSYTNQLDADQKNMHKFKHDYKNIILSLEELAQSENNSKLKKSLNELTSYSNNYFENTSMNFYKDLEYVANPYIKSLLISKFKTMKTLDINYSFECKSKIKDINMNTFDFIRLLGISIDNAIEEVENNPNGSIGIAIINDDKNISFSIKNSLVHSKLPTIQNMRKEGFSTKKSHSGLGMVNIQNISKKYPNLFINYHKDKGVFYVQIVLTKE